MRPSKRKTTTKSPKRNFITSPPVVLILALLLGLLLIDLYMAINKKNKKHDHKHQQSEQPGPPAWLSNVTVEKRLK